MISEQKIKACNPRGQRAGTRRWISRRAAALSAALFLTGCQRAPAYSLLGSFFPVWLFCVAAGILLAFLVHLLLLRLELDEQISPPLLVYPALATIFSLGLWLAFFS
jgi:hypothetical protein